MSQYYKKTSFLQPLCHFKLLCTQQSNTLINLVHLNFLEYGQPAGVLHMASVT
jgi:hypothetical protein